MKESSANAGFTLIEVVIAMILLTVGLMTLLSVILGGMMQREVTQEYDIAKNAAFMQIEAIRAQDFNDIVDNYNNTYFWVSGLTAPTNCYIAGGNNPGKIEIDSAVPDLFEVTVTVRWQIQGNTNPAVYNEYKSKTLLTRRSKY